MALMPTREETRRKALQKRLNDEAEKRGKEHFVKMWVAAGGTKEQAEILIEFFSRVSHEHEISFRHRNF